MIIDGTGAPAYSGSIGIENGRIVLSPTDSPLATVIDGSGLYICPGFIDCHSHGDQVIGQFPMELSKVSQGITTQIVGQCGASAFPVSPERIDLHKGLISIGTYEYPEDMVNWTSFENFIEFTNRTPLQLNMKTLIGHSTLRVAAMGYKEGIPSTKEMDSMIRLLDEAMRHGALGLSSGLIYPPGCYAKTDELIELAKVAANYGGIYASHMRNESDNIVDAVRETLLIGRKASIPVCISHHKICGRHNWGKSIDTLALIHEAIDSGMTVTIDQYPYTANATALNIVIPPKYFEKGGIPGMLDILANPHMRAQVIKDMKTPGTYDNFYINSGGFDGIFISGCTKTPETDGMYMSEYAKLVGKDPFNALFDLLIENDGLVNAIFDSISDEDCCRIILDENCCIGTDGTCRTLAEQTHPRTFGSFPRAINHYIKELNLMPLETLIQKMTSFVAKRMGISDRGIIADGLAADLVVFDYNEIKDNADYTNSTLLSSGIHHVFVNGELAYSQGCMTNKASGKLLLHNRT